MFFGVCGAADEGWIAYAVMDGRCRGKEVGVDFCDIDMDFLLTGDKRL